MIKRSVEELYEDVKEDIIELSNKTHNFYYDYTKVKDSNKREKIIISCPKHGDFLQRLDVHLNGFGCKKCGIDNKKIKFTDLTDRFNITHNNKYDYSLVEYVNNKSKIKIICPIHGEFEQTTIKHLQHGCKKCANDLLRINRQKTKEQFIIESDKIHDNKYDYSLVKYINTQIKIKIICPIHGVFEQIPNNHLSGSGCSKCSHININNFNKLNQIDLILNFNIVHDNIYDYSLVDYVNGSEKIKIICNIHGIFKQTPNSHKNGAGCPYCANIKNRLRYIEILKYRVENNIQITPNFNKYACDFFDNIMKENNSYIQHAMNEGEYYIKELGYWLDGYDKKNNIVYEFDEKHHFKNGVLRNKDYIRQIEIVNFLKCELIRIKDK